jgi:hypothetical protein
MHTNGLHHCQAKHKFVTIYMHDNSRMYNSTLTDILCRHPRLTRLLILVTYCRMVFLGKPDNWEDGDDRQNSSWRHIRRAIVYHLRKLGLSSTFHWAWDSVLFFLLLVNLHFSKLSKKSFQKSSSGDQPLKCLWNGWKFFSQLCSFYSLNYAEYHPLVYFCPAIF